MVKSEWLSTRLEIRCLLPLCFPSNSLQIPHWKLRPPGSLWVTSELYGSYHAPTVSCFYSRLMPRPGWRMLMVKYNQWSPVPSLFSKTVVLLQQGISGLRPFYVIFPMRCGRKPGDEGACAGAPGPSPQEPATFLVGRGSAHMPTGAVPRYFPILPVITIRLETARQEGPRMLLLWWVHRTQSVLPIPRVVYRSSNLVHITEALESWIPSFLVSFSSDSWSRVSAQPPRITSSFHPNLNPWVLSLYLWY